MQQKTHIIGYAGDGGAGKSACSAYAAGLVYATHGFITQWGIDEFNRIIINDLFRTRFTQPQSLDISDQYNSEHVREILNRLEPSYLSLVHEESVLLPVKETLISTFGISPNLAYGDNISRNSLTDYTVGELKALIGKKDFPFTTLIDKECLTVNHLSRLCECEMMRKIRPSILADRLSERIETIIESCNPFLIVVSDLRHPEEIKTIKEIGGTVIGLTRGTSSYNKDPIRFDLCDKVINNKQLTPHEQYVEVYKTLNKIFSSVTQSHRRIN